MSEIIHHLDISTRLALLIMVLEDGDEAKLLCQDALDEIERLKAENKKLRRAK